MPTSHSDLAVEKADLRGVIQALRYSCDEGAFRRSGVEEEVREWRTNA